MRVKLLFCVLGLAMVACIDEDDFHPARNEIVVYESGPHLTACSVPALTLTQSAERLTGAGIDVRRSSCGHFAHAQPALCGASTGEVLLHIVPAASIDAARIAGFGPADDLPGGWHPDSCPQYLHAIDVARESSSCAQLRNRVLHIRDATHQEQDVVLLDQSGFCADASYRQLLFGGTGDKQLCEYADSIAGPQKNCAAPARAEMFDTILANLDQADLGLGSGYYVRQVHPDP